MKKTNSFTIYSFAFRSNVYYNTRAMRNEIRSEKPNKKSLRLPHAGMRMIKTAVAVFICLLIYSLRGYEIGSGMSEAAVTAIVCMQPFVQDTKEYALNRLSASLIGSVWALLMLLFLMDFPVFSDNQIVLYAVMAFGVLAALYTAVLFRASDAAGLAAIIYISIIVGYPNIEQPLHSALIRMLDIHIGLAVAVLVNIIHLPRRKNRDSVFFVRTKDLVPDRFSTIPPTVLFHLNSLINDGAKICMMSEHAPAFLTLQMSAAKVSAPQIVMDGAAIYDALENEFLYIETIPVEHSLQLKKRLEAIGCSYFVYTIHKNKTCIFHHGRFTEQEQAVYDHMRSSPYRSYLEGEIYEEEEIVYYKLIAADGVIAGLEAALGDVLTDGHFRSVIRPQAGEPGISALYIYSAEATNEHAEKVMMWILCTENETLKPVEVFADRPYHSESDAMRLLRKLGNAYEPIGFPKKENKVNEKKPLRTL